MAAIVAAEAVLMDDNDGGRREEGLDPEEVYDPTKPYPQGQNANKCVLDDLNHELPDDVIIGKLLATNDVNAALWESSHPPYFYAPIHHAASRGRSILLQFILANRSSPDQVNLCNTNWMTPLRYAKRNDLPAIIEILEGSGATEAFPETTLVCSDLGEGCPRNFVFRSSDQQKFHSMGFAPPTRCPHCRRLKRERHPRREGRGARPPPPLPDGRRHDGPRDRPPRDGPRDHPPHDGPRDRPPRDHAPFDGPRDRPPRDRPPHDGPRDRPPHDGPRDRPPHEGPRDRPPRDGPDAPRGHGRGGRFGRGPPPPGGHDGDGRGRGRGRFDGPAPGRGGRV